MTLTQKDIRALLHNSPFKPFRVHLTDGKTLAVQHPDFLMAAAEQIVINTEITTDPFAGLNIVPYEAISRIEFLSSPKRGKAAA